MPRPAASRMTVVAALLLILSLLAAGCMTIPGPGDTTKSPTLTPRPAATVQSPVVPLKTAQAAATTIPVTATEIVTPGYENTSCSAQNGFVVSPVERCSGVYLIATDTFSCCSKRPVAGGNATALVAVPALALPLNPDDDLGNITA